MRIAVCISTFHRAEGLGVVLDSIANQTIEGHDLSIVVTNNDPDDRKPHEICARASETLPWPIVCLDERVRGLAAPRNRSLEHAIPEHDFIAFIDDDSRADPDWLRALLAVQEQFDADVVTGPAEPEYEHAPEPWLERAGFFAREHRATGSRLDRAFTHNVLIRTEILERTGVRFDLRFGTIGGEDTHFFRRLQIAGASIVWADHALIADRVPAERMTQDWLVRRHWRTGMTTVQIERDLGSSGFGYTVWTLARAGVWQVLGLGALIGSAVGGKAVRVRAQCWRGWSKGLAAGLRGHTYHEYLEER